MNRVQIERIGAGVVADDIDAILNAITHSTPVRGVEVSSNHHIELHNEVINERFEVDVLEYQRVHDNRLAFDIDANFFCRPSWSGQPLISVGHLLSGERYLCGSASDGRSALPKSSPLWLYHPGTGRSVSIQTDGAGRFAAELPAGITGTAYLVRVDEQSRAVGAEIELP